MTAPVPTVEVAWDPGNQVGAWRIDESEIDGDDGLAGAFGLNAFDDISSAAKAISISRGRSSNLGMVSAGQATITLRDTDGTYNPRNPSSSLADYLAPFLPVRITAPDSGAIVRGLFYGFIQDISHNPDARQSTIQCIDLYDWLTNASPTIAATGPTTTGAAIGLVLDSIGWDQADMRDLDAGDSIADFSADGSKTAWTLIEELQCVDLGQFFIDGSGRAVYRDHTARWSRSDVVATFDGSVVTRLSPGLSARSLFNRQTVTREGGTPQTYTDPAYTTQGYRDGTAITTPYLATDAQALRLATFLATFIGVDGLPPLDAVELIGGDTARIDHILTRELSDRVAVTESQGNTDAEGLIESLQIDWAVGGPWRGSYVVGERLIDMFTLDLSEIDGDDGLAY